MTIQPTRSPLFYGTDPVAGAVRAVLDSTVRDRTERAAGASEQRALSFNLQALYPSLFAPEPAVRRRWLPRRALAAER